MGKNIYFENEQGEKYLLNVDKNAYKRFVNIIDSNKTYIFNNIKNVSSYTTEDVNIKSKNEDFIVSIGYGGVTFDTNPSKYTSDYGVHGYLNNIYGKEIRSIYCKNTELYNLVNSKFNKLLSKIQVEISECPKWMQESLRSQIKYKQDHEYEEQIKQENQTKRLNLIKKIFRY